MSIHYIFCARRGAAAVTYCEARSKKKTKIVRVTLFSFSFFPPPTVTTAEYNQHDIRK